MGEITALKKEIAALKRELKKKRAAVQRLDRKIVWYIGENNIKTEGNTWRDERIAELEEVGYALVCTVAGTHWDVLVEHGYTIDHERGAVVKNDLP